ncbi:uncharacterized protein F5147DRAFT_715220 [Suillus discolor]|uniref:Uncharacterized protein n=1 Tax=Suillus discolor TaxID=1912936 RepID=A0A9P7JPX6_9AGAM|nr:uncharacterized protein F5147DRAFT_715220 [Suillus discolor]KAG2097230.1 hypothetical protein F5147DRAFT_715220 [Suillus discolor]
MLYLFIWMIIVSIMARTERRPMFNTNTSRSRMCSSAVHPSVIGTPSLFSTIQANLGQRTPVSSHLRPSGQQYFVILQVSGQPLAPSSLTVGIDTVNLKAEGDGRKTACFYVLK